MRLFIYSSFYDNPDRQSYGRIENMKGLCKESMYDYAIPDKYIFVSEFPLTGMGKIDYRALEQKDENDSCGVAK